MKNKVVNPAYLQGTIRIPASKSLTHRALICAALSEELEKSFLYGVDWSEDTGATRDALSQMGANIQYENDIVTVSRGMGTSVDKKDIFCKESASTLRFLIPVVAAYALNATFSGAGKLPQRPIGLYQDLLQEKGVTIQFQGKEGDFLPMTMHGKLEAGTFYVSGTITSQFITGLLLALPLLDGNSEIILTSRLESEPYVDMTREVQNIFGVVIQKSSKGYYIAGRQKCHAASYIVEGDFSSAAFFACAAAINGDISMQGLSSFSYQGDYRIVELLLAFGAKAAFEGNLLHVQKAEHLRAISIDATHIPDLVPILAVVAAYAEGKTRIHHAQRLRLKESDRLAALTSMLTAIGADITELEDGLEIVGKPRLKGGMVCAYGDHRIAMAATIAALRCENPVVIDDMDCIRKSYPAFWDAFSALRIESERNKK